jgi:hypothetical protein
MAGGGAKDRASPRRKWRRMVRYRLGPYTTGLLIGSCIVLGGGLLLRLVVMRPGDHAGAAAASGAAAARVHPAGPSRRLARHAAASPAAERPAPSHAPMPGTRPGAFVRHLATYTLRLTFALDTAMRGKHQDRALVRANLHYTHPLIMASWHAVLQSRRSVPPSVFRRLSAAWQDYRRAEAAATRFANGERGTNARAARDAYFAASRTSRAVLRSLGGADQLDGDIPDD